MPINRKDLACGLLFVAIGAGFALHAWANLRIGRAFAMGPGFFPVALGLILAAFGAIVALGSFNRPAEAFGAVPWRGVALILGAVLFFAVAVRRLGFAPTIFIATGMAALSTPRATWRGTLLLGLAMTAFATLTFVFALRLPYPVIGPWLGG